MPWRESSRFHSFFLGMVSSQSCYHVRLVSRKSFVSHVIREQGTGTGTGTGTGRDGSNQTRPDRRNTGREYIERAR